MTSTLDFKDGMRVLGFVAEIINDYKPSPKRIYSLLAYQRNRMRSDLLTYFCDDSAEAEFIYKADPKDDLLFDWNMDYMDMIPGTQSKALFYDDMTLLNFILHVVNEASPSHKQVEFLLSFKKPALREILGAYLREFEGQSEPGLEVEEAETFKLGIDYSKPVHEFIANAGFYMIDKGISQRHFKVGPIPTKLFLHLKLYPYEGTLADARRIAAEKRLALAGLLEILAFAAKYPDAQRHQNIIEIRDAWSRPAGDHFVCLTEKNRRRFGKVIPENAELKRSAILLIA
jgi:hypothetical protein